MYTYFGVITERMDTNMNTFIFVPKRPFKILDTGPSK